MTATLPQKPTAGLPAPAAPGRRIAWHVLAPGAVTLGLGLWGLAGPSYWRDESFSVVAARMPWPDLLALLERMDAVHGLYYAFLHVVTLFGTGEIVTRLPSVLGAAGASAGLGVLGARLAGPRTGLYAGLIYALLPTVSRFAQETRSYALVSAGAVLATLLLLRQGRFVLYAAVMTLLGWLHIYALLLLPAHAAVLLLLGHRRRLPAWGCAAAAVTLVVSPLAVLARDQSELTGSWIASPGPLAPAGFLLFAAGPPLALACAVALSCGLWTARPWTSRLVLVAVPWLAVPPLLAITVSHVVPLYQPRYVLFSLPALALLAGAGLDRLTSVRGSHARDHTVPVIAVCLALSVLAAGALPAQMAIRRPGSRPDDLRGLAGVLRDQSRAGDAVMFVPAYRRPMVTAYRDAFAKLDDRTLAGTGLDDLPTPSFRAALERTRRVWVIECPPPLGRYQDPTGPANLTVLRGAPGFVREASRTFGTVRLHLHTSINYSP